MKLTLFILVLSLACTATLARKTRRADDTGNGNADANANANADTNNKDGDKAAAGANGAAPAFGIGACINRFVCSLPTYEDGTAGGAAANGDQDCYAGGNAWKKDQANCATLCANNGQGNNGVGNGDDDAKDDVKVNCEAPDCSNADTKNHYYCMVDCRDADSKAAEPEVCNGVTCKDGEDDKATDPNDANKDVDDWRCPGGTPAAGRRRMKIRRKMQARLGKFALRGNYKGMNMMLRRMAKMGEYHCKRTGFMKYLMYPIAIFKCIFHKMYCMFATCGDNTVTILDGPDCKDAANKDMDECKKVDCADAANKDNAECKKGGTTTTPECWKDGKDVADLTLCPAGVCDLDANKDEAMCKNPKAATPNADDTTR